MHASGTAQRVYAVTQNKDREHPIERGFDWTLLNEEGAPRNVLWRAILLAGRARGGERCDENQIVELLDNPSIDILAFNHMARHNQSRVRGAWMRRADEDGVCIVDRVRSERATGALEQVAEVCHTLEVQRLIRDRVVEKKSRVLGCALARNPALDGDIAATLLHALSGMYPSPGTLDTQTLLSVDNLLSMRRDVAGALACAVREPLWIGALVRGADLDLRGVENLACALEERGGDVSLAWRDVTFATLCRNQSALRAGRGVLEAAFVRMSSSMGTRTRRACREALGEGATTHMRFDAGYVTSLLRCDVEEWVEDQADEIVRTRRNLHALMLACNPTTADETFCRLVGLIPRWELPVLRRLRKLWVSNPPLVGECAKRSSMVLDDELWDRGIREEIADTALRRTPCDETGVEWEVLFRHAGCESGTMASHLPAHAGVMKPEQRRAALIFVESHLGGDSHRWELFEALCAQGMTFKDAALAASSV